MTKFSGHTKGPFTSSSPLFLLEATFTLELYGTEFACYSTFSCNNTCVHTLLIPVVSDRMCIAPQIYMFHGQTKFWIEY